MGVNTESQYLKKPPSGKINEANTTGNWHIGSVSQYCDVYQDHMEQSPWDENLEQIILSSQDTDRERAVGIVKNKASELSIADLTEEKIRQVLASAHTSKKIRPLIDALRMRWELADDSQEDMQVWLKKPLVEWNGMSPLDRLLDNDFDAVIQIVERIYCSKIETIFSQIDLAQARITKDQKEIQSLAKKTDDLLNQLEYKAS